MPRTSSHEFLAEAAGVKIVASPPEDDPSSVLALGKIILRIPRVNETSDQSFGFHLTKSRWDPFPWISYIENGSLADSIGLRTGDCLLSVDDVDLVGLRVADVATLIRKEEGDSHINIAIWRCPPQKKPQDDVGLALKGPLPDVAKNLVCALSGTVRALECPICLETAVPPVSQCVHGHILCATCRPKMTRCPVCRVQLAQGRCLLADNLHRVLRDTYFDANDRQTAANRSVASDRCNLRDQLFGKSKKQESETLAVTRANNCSTSKPKQFLLTRLLLGGGREKAASADNLTRVSRIGEEVAASVPHRGATLAGNLLRLTVNDRAKSASTGELSRDNRAGQCIIDSTMSSSGIVGSSRELYSRPDASQQSWGSLQTSVFSGSTDSVNNVLLACPLTLCNEKMYARALMEHMKSHQVPQVHFFSESATIPLPIPFGTDVFYILHHDGYMFFFRYTNESAWMSTTMVNEIEWTLHGWGDSESEIYLRRYVMTLAVPITMSVRYIAPLPRSLSLKVLNIRILDQQDDFYV